MTNKIIIVYLVSVLIFSLSGGLLLAFPLIMGSAKKGPPTIDDVARNLILDRCPMTATIINAIIVFTTALLTLPALVMPTTRAWLKLQGYLITICAFLSLVLGVFLWFDTLRTRFNLFPIYLGLDSRSQSLIQQRFNCCGYFTAAEPAFVRDQTCTGAIQASMMQGCVGPLSKYANGIEDVVFTAMFGVVGVDVLGILAVTMLLKDRGERERYRWLDMKSGRGGF